MLTGHIIFIYECFTKSTSAYEQYVYNITAQITDHLITVKIIDIDIFFTIYGWYSMLAATLLRETPVG